MRLQIPEGNVRVPLDQFEDVWTRAEALARETGGSRYLGGVCAACRWVAGHPQAVSPLHGRPIRADPELILEEDMLATTTYAGGTGADVNIDRDWAAGVAMTLGWVRGALPDNPLSPS